MKICLAGEGAMGFNHIKVLQQLDDVEVVTLAGGVEEDAAAFAQAWEIPHYSLDLETCLNQPEVEAVVLATPNQVHAAQAEQALSMGKHVLVEIPMGLNLAEAEHLVDMEEKTGLVCMVCHSYRYSAPHREIVRRVRTGELHLHHIVQQTYFFRRKNTNMFGKPRSWTDELLWHQACHMVDFIYWLFDEPDIEAWAQTGPTHPGLGIPMDITIGMRSKSGCLVSSANSFNNHGSITSNYRFIGEEATFLIEKGKLIDHDGNEVSVAVGGLEVQDREFLDAIKNGRTPMTSCKTCLPTMAILDRLQGIIGD
jgi:2-hydroxy-4-carboxymuconate semialdehyde hemiacetal dehydrogenase|tara:strand:- start:31 stop:960 length:930 start_codon:yes stop_codon:yes gene_type:complete